MSFFLFIFYFFYFPVECQEVTNRFPTVRLGVGGRLPKKHLLQPAAMSAKELRLYNQVLAEINLDISDGSTTSTSGETDNTIYFTREQFATRLRFPVPSLVKQFLHFTRAPLALVHPNVFRILMGYSVLNSLYQLNISLVEICFIYTLKLGIGGRLSMSAHNPWLQFVYVLPNSLKMEAKGVVFVRGSWHVTLGTPGLPFDMNQSLSFPCMF